MEARNSINSLKCSPKQPSKVTIWDSSKLVRLTGTEKEDMRYIIDEMGRLSAHAQRLKVPITDFERMRLGSQTLYLLTSNGASKDLILVKGLLKVGQKNLFIRKECGALVEINPLCVLDFYVHVSCQRIGLGRLIFDAMLGHTKKLAHQLGFDRPSQKLISFLSKHYSLKRFYPQANQFVIYNAYFDSSCQDEIRVQSRVCDCIRGDQKTCTVASLQSPRAKEIHHGRRATKTPEPVHVAKVPMSSKTEPPTGDRLSTPSFPLRRRTVLQDDEVKVVPSVMQVFSDYQPSPTLAVETHYDWMTGMRKPILRTLPRRVVEFATQDSCPELLERSRLRSGTVSTRERLMSKAGRANSPKTSHRAQLSGFGAAAALGFNQRA